MYPFYIPSIYRPDSEFLINLRDSNFKFYIIIAKHQYEDYAKNYNPRNLIVLPPNIIKISEIRQYILNIARKNKETKIWMSDDDLKNFFIKTPHSSILEKVNFKTFISKAEKNINTISKYEPLIVQYGFKYSTFAIPAKKYTINTNIGMIQLLDIEKTKKIDYDTTFITLEDTDFTFNLFNNGFKNCQLNHFIFTAPKSGTGKGGLENMYKEGAKQRGIKQFQDKYNTLIKIIDLKMGKYKINWKLYQDLELERKIPF
jgi:hypothetical protein